MRNRAIEILPFLLVLFLVPVVAGASTPDWLRSLAQQTQKKYADDVDAVVLLDDKQTTLKDSGEIVTLRRVAYRILRPEGKEVAGFGLFYDSETKVNYLRGWSITAKGQEYEAKDKDAFERSISTYEVYSDDKEKILHVPGDDVGTVVGFEFERKNRPYVFDDTWVFQKSIPVERSRYTLRLPSSWEMK